MTAPDKAFEKWKRVSKQSYLNAHEEHVARTAWLASRKAALEEAAKVCDEYIHEAAPAVRPLVALGCPARILALIVDNPPAKVVNQQAKG